MNDTVADKITEKTVRDRLLRLFNPHIELIAFNICGFGPYHHEIDFLRVLRSGWAHEFEIKVTRADIVNEAKKLVKYNDLELGVQRSLSWSEYSGTLFVPTDHVEVGQVCMPYIHTSAHGHKSACARYETPVRNFWVAVPAENNIATFAMDKLPSWVGVIELSTRGYFDTSVRRKASALKYARKVTDGERVQILKSVNHKYWNLYKERGGTGRK